MSDDLIERLRSGKIKCPPLEPTLSERPMTLSEWRAAGIEAAEALTRSSSSSELVEALREARRIVEWVTKASFLTSYDMQDAVKALAKIDSALSKTISAGGRD